jgi:hypothetical protein
MYLGLTLILNGIMLAVSLTQLIPEGNWLYLAMLVFSTCTVVWVLPRIK